MMAVDQFLNGRNVVDQAYHHSTAPGASIHITVNHNFRLNTRDHVVNIINLELGALLAFNFK